MQCGGLYGENEMSGTASVRRCRQCLLREMAGENDYYRSVLLYRETMPRKKRAPDDVYEARLRACKACASLENGTCRQCGCYVEMRAARIDMHCPRADALW